MRSRVLSSRNRMEIGSEPRQFWREPRDVSSALTVLMHQFSSLGITFMWSKDNSDELKFFYGFADVNLDSTCLRPFIPLIAMRDAWRSHLEIELDCDVPTLHLRAFFISVDDAYFAEEYKFAYMQLKCSSDTSIWEHREVKGRQQKRADDPEHA